MREILMPRFGLVAVFCALLGSVLFLVGLAERPNTDRIAVELALLLPALVIFVGDRLRVRY